MMKKLFFVAVAVLMLTGTSVAAENVAVDNSIAVAEAPNAYDKVIALVKTYTKRIKAARSFEELEVVAANLEKDAAAMEKNLGKELEALAATLSEKELEDYEKAFNAAMEELMKAVEEKSGELMGEDIIIKTGSIQHSDRI